MKKLFRRLMAVAVAAALTAGMCITASAYTYPSAYWKLHDAWSQAVAAKSADQVLTVGDEIATVSGLERAEYGEILVFSNGVKGMVQDLRPGRVGCILFGGSEAIEEGSIVRRTGRTAGVPVGDGFLGRVVDALGTPIDGKGDIPAENYLPIESRPPASSTASR